MPSLSREKDGEKIAIGGPNDNFLKFYSNTKMDSLKNGPSYTKIMFQFNNLVFLTLFRK
jgi:hypothetical protein